MRIAARSHQGGRQQGRLRVVTYHRVADVADGNTVLDPRLISTTPALFARQMEHLARHYRVVTLHEVIDAVNGRASLPAHATLITFDDGYRDLKDHAFPVLRRLQLPATVFVATAFPADPERAFWWDRVYRALIGTPRRAWELPPLGLLRFRDKAERTESIRRLQNHIVTLPHSEGMRLVDAICAEAGARDAAPASVLSWQELREAGAHGVTVAAHTRTHPILTNVPLEQARAEIAGSLVDVERETGAAAPAFCYPNGNENEAVVRAVREAGVAVAFTTSNGHNDLARAHPLRLSRQNIYRNSSLPVFRARLSAMGGYLDAWRSRVRLPRSNHARTAP